MKLDKKKKKEQKKGSLSLGRGVARLQLFFLAFSLNNFNF
jgi:hypothetical protein